MLTLKHISSSGRQRIISADEVLHDAGSPLITATIRRREVVVTLEPSDIVYIENAAGKTIEVIRARS